MILKIIQKNLVKLRRWQRYNNTVNELSRLSNRDLADLGITRCDIARVARQSVRKTDSRKAQLA